MSDDQFEEMMEVLRAIGRQLEQANGALHEIKVHASIAEGNTGDILQKLGKWDVE